MNDLFAVDPGAPSDQMELAGFLRLFRTGEGRFIASFPHHWSALLVERLSESSDLGPMIAREAQRRLQHALLPSKARYHPSRPWIENAAALANDVAKIIGCRNCPPVATPLAAVLSGLEDLPDSSGGHLPMTAESYARAASPLFHTSPAVCLVDPYFRLRRQVGGKWVDDRRVAVLRALFAAARAGRKTELFRLTVSRDHALEGDPDAVAFNARARRLAQEVGSDSLRVEVALLEDLGSVHEHARYLLGTSSGLHFDHGFDINAVAKNHVHWMRSSELTPILNHFMRPPPATPKRN